MKKVIFLFSFFALTVVSALARPVDRQTATHVAQNLWYQVSKSPFALTDVSMELGFEHLYIFANLDGNGFVVLPADDCATPVLAYSTDNQFSLSNMPVHVESWLRAYNDEIAQLVAVGAEADKTVADEWYRLLNDLPLVDASKAAVTPLLTTTWNQEPFYNNLCPLYDGVHRSVTGCTATATAQVMKYWNHPRTGFGSRTYIDTLSEMNVYDTLTADFGATTYDWEHMPNALTSSSSDTEVLAVATLIYHVGIAVDMDYGSSSGAYTTSFGFFNWGASENALPYYFKYSSELRGVEKNHVGDAEWKQMLKADLNAGRPIIYSGEDRSGGHAFVCDGYNSLSRFHFNWGWGGLYDGYYSIGSLNPSYSFNLNNTAILGIYPDTVQRTDAVHVEVMSSDTAMGVVAGGGDFMPYHDTVTFTADAKEGYRFQRWSDDNIYIPRSFMPNNDHSLTAIFEPLAQDSVTYSFDLFFSRCSKDRYYDYFAIRIPSTAMASCRNLSKVQMYDGFVGHYQLFVYEGGEEAPQRLLHSQNFNTRRALKWMDIAMDSTVLVDASQPLWVVVRSLDSNSWAPVSYFSGNYDGTWYSFDSVNWQHEWGNHPFSWMLRAPFSPRDPNTFNVTVNTSSEMLGTVSGGGAFLEGDTATLTAVAVEGYRFDHWSNGSRENPLIFEVRSDTTLTAYFVEDIAINTVEKAEIVIRPNPSRDVVSIEGVKVLQIDIIDVVGRVVMQFNGTNTINLGTLPPSIYTLRITTPEGNVVGKVMKAK